MADPANQPIFDKIAKMALLNPCMKFEIILGKMTSFEVTNLISIFFEYEIIFRSSAYSDPNPRSMWVGGLFPIFSNTYKLRLSRQIGYFQN